MQAVDVYYSKKMADDSRIHHILEDSMFKPRKTWVKEDHYQLSEVQNHPPFKHKERLLVRRFISQAYRLKSSQENGIAQNVLEEPKPIKNVSFNKLPVTPQMQEIDEECPTSPTDSEKGPVKFTLGLSEIKSTDAIKKTSPPTPPTRIKAPTPPLPKETELERSLPWKRQVTNDPLPCAVTLDMPDDDKPLFSPLPSWASNPAYHHLKDSGSPYVSPETTIIASPPPVSQPSVFEVFQSMSNKDTEDIDTLPPPPWKENDQIEPVTACVSNTMSDKLTHNLHSFHDDINIPSTHSVIIPNDLEEDLPKSSSIPGSASNSVLPKHWQPIEMQSIPRKRSAMEAEAFMDEIAFQHEVTSRVQKWLASSNSDVEPGDQRMEDVEDAGDIEGENVESDTETSYL